ncbi:hypothetical protein P167DRAFT_610124 [Morchella conica CCBAS932]|uniref:Uncharacterized protein n=1 Tax=Morchella conica CCBAS932 TaxID=1392247 RepID=A0A3N4K737_9PEZI|nr:hypothetical protein P167DRAFT_610124 [Morchella conica CCBAS932]
MNKQHTSAPSTSAPSTPQRRHFFPATTPRCLPDTTPHRFTPHITPLKMPPIRPLPSAVRGAASGERVRQLKVPPVRMMGLVGMSGLGCGVTVRRGRGRGSARWVERGEGRGGLVAGAVAGARAGVESGVDLDDRGRVEVASEER